jgi:hypothetical protein
MGKFLVGAATAALWFVLSHAANANGIVPSGAQGQVQVEISSAGLAIERRTPRGVRNAIARFAIIAPGFSTP